MEIQFAKTALLTRTSSLKPLKPGLVGSEGKPSIVLWVLTPLPVGSS